MHATHLDAMIDGLRAVPKRTGQPILTAWNVKEDLMDLLALHSTHPTRPQISSLLTTFYENATASELPECERLAQTISTWWPQNLAGITTGVTNPGSEGVNRVIKTDTRCAYGHRNPVNQRLRTRAATTRRARPPRTPDQQPPRPTTTIRPLSTIELEEPRSAALAGPLDDGPRARPSRCAERAQSRPDARGPAG
ncbi:transposase [Streptantibioticus cattleyicolor]|uniref:Transposase, IS204/IS1001/IS1096/IS1165 n=1 Tax=Streptantibioticus cattleyicolor (strain ATCC 35852 / DSM 46488 / JCM 4925 / NBRC 14057 / NRRL 8057) TaxID=1003195 RepID=F8JNI5_STREN|nr:transposase [Streptantibioticus cattleyicolor]AEW99046.1 transposase, IS204/IS1001/IS1096/IS1165 [Streptantibioticus cattleyicolor NRRL 8057 = DSM 46488]CCB71905.1 protein of unknown function [Streptantibioticus cattleyicolor NRRL 8057 = DSM 46488]